MLLQHHIADSLKPHIPVGWNEAMRELGQLPPGENNAPRQSRMRRKQSMEATEEGEAPVISEEVTDDIDMVEDIESGVEDEDSRVIDDDSVA